MLAIEAVALEKTYRTLFSRAGQRALTGLDLVVPRGAAFGLIGPNGAGKTTFIKAILGVVRPTSGSVRALGGSPEDPRVRARIGYLPERLHLPGALTPVQFLASVARLKGVGGRREVLARQLERVGLAGDAGRKVGGFSKGMKQRLGLAAALLGEPELLVLDEPTDGVNPLGRAEIRRILAEERARGATVFLNSHLLSETERVCDRVGILAGGRLVREGSLDELCAEGPRWRARFDGGDAAALAEAGFTPAGEGAFTCDARTPAELDARLVRARAAGALVVELGRETRDLEAVLAEAVSMGPRGEA